MPGEREGKSDFQELSRIQESLRLDSALFLRWPLWPDSVHPGYSWVLGQKGSRKSVEVLLIQGTAGGARAESEGSGRDSGARGLKCLLQLEQVLICRVRKGLPHAGRPGDNQGCRVVLGVDASLLTERPVATSAWTRRFWDPQSPCL